MGGKKAKEEKEEENAVTEEKENEEKDWRGGKLKSRLKSRKLKMGVLIGEKENWAAMIDRKVDDDTNDNYY